ncbi:hypothetical protein NEUTE2DRAFT_140284 [Neurospora tetrasperma FGSC 2509]|nr:hypothetical protein NEUTE2DRAFT_140284 [Neurospora tetrasperma FGSC 2509]
MYASVPRGRAGSTSTAGPSNANNIYVSRSDLCDKFDVMRTLVSFFGLSAKCQKLPKLRHRDRWPVHTYPDSLWGKAPSQAENGYNNAVKQLFDVLWRTLAAWEVTIERMHA